VIVVLLAGAVAASLLVPRRPGHGAAVPETAALPDKG